MQAREYLESILPTRDEVARFLVPRRGDGLHPNRGWTFDALLGWVHAGAVHERDGVGGSRTIYTYELDGARRLIQGAGAIARIHTYGDSFTHGDQVNDGETWQEYLADHLCEPIRNYGVGGYSVYQAYRRMKQVELAGSSNATHIILNIYDDDHFRNLDSWRRLRLGRNTSCGFTLPHLRVNVETGECREVENLIRDADAVYHLCDADWVYKTFKDDPILAFTLAMQARKDHAPRPDEFEAVATSFGLPPHLSTGSQRAAALHRLHLEASLFATRRVLEWFDEFTRANEKKLMVVLSYGAANMAAALRGEARFDQALLDFLRTRDYPTIDMRDAFATGFATSRLDVDAYLARYYNGHHTPAGNFFTAWAIKDRVVAWLNPKPLPYR